MLDVAGGRETYDSCTRAQRIFGVDRVLVVSQGYPLPRAVTTCRAVGLHAEGVGDWTGRRYAAQRSSGERRDKLAAGKTVIDLLTGRPHGCQVSRALSATVAVPSVAEPATGAGAAACPTSWVSRARSHGMTASSVIRPVTPKARG